MGNKMKKYIITAIVGAIIGELIWIFVIGGISIYAMDQADIIDMDELFGMGSTGGSRTYASGDIAGLLKSAEIIANFMRDHNYRYYTHHPNPMYHDGEHFNNVYNIGSYDVSCCATYVSWCLQEAGFISDDMHTEEVCWSFGSNGEPLSGIWKIMIDSPDWKNVEDIIGRPVKGEEDLLPGDIQIYKNGGSHTNIYAGNGEYWDAGQDEAGAFEGVTKTHPMDKYTCSFRHKSMWSK